MRCDITNQNNPKTTADQLSDAGMGALECVALHVCCCVRAWHSGKKKGSPSPKKRRPTPTPLDELSARVASLEARALAAESRLDELDSRVVGLRPHIAELHSRIGRLEEVTRASFTQLRASLGRVMKVLEKS